MALPLPNFIDRDPQTIINEMVADYEARVGKRLEPSQVERLLINAFAYRELLLRNQIQDAAMQNLIAFARYPMLDYLGQLLGVTRLPATSAETTIRFFLVTGHGGVVIPQGIRVASIDGKAVFETKVDANAAPGVGYVDIICRCQADGASGNGYQVGNVNLILDPQPYLAAAENITVTDGGSDEETDEQLRERIRLAPSAFSTAGPRGAYIYHAKSAHPTIIDVSVVSPTPGKVEIYPLVAGGDTTPPEILAAVEAACSDDKVRPLTDTVEVLSPTKVDYDIEVDLTLYTDADQQTVIQQVTSNLEAFRDGRKLLLGQDIIVSQIIGACMVDGVYDVDVVSPASDLIIDETEFGNCLTILVNVTGTNDG